MKLISQTLLALLLAVAPAVAEKRAFTIEDLYRVQDLADPQVSPDGRTLLYTVGTKDLGRAKRQTHVFSLPLAGGEPRQLTYSEKSESAPRFSPDGRTIAFLSTRSGDANLYLMPTDGGEARPLTKISTGVSDPVWSPDGRWIAFATDVYPECGADEACNKKISDRWKEGPLKAHMADALLYRHWTAWKDGTRTHIFLVAVPGGEVRDVTPGDHDSPPFQLGGGVAYDFSPDSKELVFASTRSPDSLATSRTSSGLDSTTGPPGRRVCSPSPSGTGSTSSTGRAARGRSPSPPRSRATLRSIGWTWLRAPSRSC
jgi:Tol biopolymer transport system component